MKILRYFVMIIMALHSLAYGQVHGQVHGQGQEKDIGPILENPARLRSFIEQEQQKILALNPKAEAIVAVEGRDFILASILAYKLKLPLILSRRASKLPVNPDPNKSPQSTIFEVILSNGKKEKMAIHQEALKPGQKVVVIGSDLQGDYPTQGTKDLVKKMGAEVTSEICWREENLDIDILDQKRLDELSVVMRPSLSPTKKKEIFQMLKDPETFRTVEDWPQPGVLFKDITSLLAQPEKYQAAIDLIVDELRSQKIAGIWGLESRGFLFAPAAYELGIPFYPVHKKGKILGAKKSATIDLEYGKDEIEVSMGAMRTKVAGGVEDERPKAVIVDDLVATGGTFEGACALAQDMGWKVGSAVCLIELPELGGRKRLMEKYSIPLISFVELEGEKKENGRKKLKIKVTSEKAVKLNPVREVFAELFPDREIEVEGFSVPSGVAPQPLGLESGLLGAKQRSENLRQQLPESYDFVVSIENTFIPGHDGQDHWEDRVAVHLWDQHERREYQGSELPGSHVESFYGQRSKLFEELDQFHRQKPNQASGGLTRTIGKMIKAHWMARGQKVDDGDWHQQFSLEKRPRWEMIKEELKNFMIKSKWEIGSKEGE